MKKFRRRRLTSTQIIMLTFLGVIIAGTILLSIPAATASGERAPLMTALFTSTTSVCVTGLVVVDTFSYWSLFGQIIILILIQIGGLGVVSIWGWFMLLLRKQLSLESRLIIRDYYDLDTVNGLTRFLKRVIYGTLIAECIGTLLYCLVFIRKNNVFKGFWQALFTAVSAFCNAGIDILGPDSLIPYQTNLLMNFTTMLLIIFGGLGFIVWFDIVRTFLECRKIKCNARVFFRRLHEHSRLVLISTAILIAAGTVLVLIGEYNNPETIGSLPIGGKLLASLFQSVTFRTAGFSTVPQQGLTPFTCIAGLVFMFIGGSPAGTAGGVKTVTAAIILLNTFAYIRQKDEPVVFGRRVTHQLVSKAIAVVSVSFTVTIVFALGLLLTDNVPTLSAVYEIFSATGTVGLSRGITSTLSNAGKMIVILAMYAGRIAPISMMLFFSTGRQNKDNVRYSKGRYLIG